MPLIEFQAQLEHFKNSDDFSFDISDDIDRLAESCESPEECIAVILGFMEQNPDIDYGAPGSLVTFLEAFVGEGYEQELIKSVSERPTPHTLWMLNRLLNGQTLDPFWKQALGVLAAVMANESVDEATRAVAEEFYQVHASLQPA